MKYWLGFLFVLEACCLAITIIQVVTGGTGFVRTIQSLLLLAAFIKTEYDWLSLSKRAPAKTE